MTFISSDYVYIEPSAPPAEELASDRISLPPAYEEVEAHDLLSPAPSAPSMDAVMREYAAAMGKFSVPSENEPLFIENILLRQDTPSTTRKKISLNRDHQKQVDTLIKESKNLHQPLDLRSDLFKDSKINKLVVTLAEIASDQPAGASQNPLTPWASSFDTISKILSYIAESKLPSENKTMLDITLRIAFAKCALEHFKEMGQYKAFDGGMLAHPSSLIFINHLHKLMTFDGRYAPVIDIKCEVLKSVIIPHALQLNEMLDSRNVDVKQPYHLLREQFFSHLDSYLSALSSFDQSLAKTYLIDSFNDTLFSELKKIVCETAAKSNDPELLARRIKQITLLAKGSTETVAEEMISKYLSLLEQNGPSSLQRALEVSSHLSTQVAHEGLKSLLADQALAATLQNESKRYQLAANNTLLPSLWLEDIDAIYECFQRQAVFTASCLKGKISLPETIALSSYLFDPLVQKIRGQVESKSSSKSLEEKCSTAQKLIEQCVGQSIDHIPQEEKQRAKDLLERYLGAQLATRLYLSRGSSYKHIALEELDTRGYLPMSLYQDGCRLQKLLMLGGKELKDFNFVKEDISYILPLEQIKERLQHIEEGLKKEKNNLLEAQKKTLRWALKLLTDPSVKMTPPPSAEDALFKSVEIEFIYEQIDIVLDELKSLRGEQCNGLIHNAWVNYVKTLAEKILSYDDIAPPIDKSKISNEEIALIKEVLQSDTALGKGQSLIMDKALSKDFFTFTLGALSLHDFIKETDLTGFNRAKEAVTTAKEEFDRLKLREKMLIGEGITPTPIRNKEEEIVGFTADPNSILGELSRDLTALLTCE